MEARLEAIVESKFPALWQTLPSDLSVVLDLYLYVKILCFVLFVDNNELSLTFFSNCCEVGNRLRSARHSGNRLARYCSNLKRAILGLFHRIRQVRVSISECHALLSYFLAFLFVACLESSFSFFIGDIKNCQDISAIVESIIIFIVGDTRHISYISLLLYLLFVFFIFLSISLSYLAQFAEPNAAFLI